MCYDADRTDAGAMIFPCACKGDVAAVHEKCLKRWLMEVSAEAVIINCRHCLLEVLESPLQKDSLISSQIVVLYLL